MLCFLCVPLTNMPGLCVFCRCVSRPVLALRPADGVRAQGFLKIWGEPQEIFIRTQYAILFYISNVREYSFFYLCDSVVCLLRLLTSICVQC